MEKIFKPMRGINVSIASTRPHNTGAFWKGLSIYINNSRRPDIEKFNSIINVPDTEKRTLKLMHLGTGAEVGDKIVIYNTDPYFILARGVLGENNSVICDF